MKHNGKRTGGPRHWRPLERAHPQTIGPEHEAVVKETMRVYQINRREAAAKLDAYNAECEIWVNDLYQVQVRRPREADGLVHLNIRRRDGAHDLRDWRHFQEIKNQLLGPECEAIELYPAESRKVDTSNKFHLWGYADPEFRFPIGFDRRDVDYTQLADGVPGLRQRPL